MKKQKSLWLLFMGLFFASYTVLASNALFDGKELLLVDDERNERASGCCEAFLSFFQRCFLSAGKKTSSTCEDDSSVNSLMWNEQDGTWFRLVEIKNKKGNAEHSADQ